MTFSISGPLPMKILKIMLIYQYNAFKSYIISKDFYYKEIKEIK